MDPQHIILRLETKLRKAREWRERARSEFDANTHDGVGRYPCSGLAIRNSGRSYSKAIQAAQKALIDHTDFIVHGTVPEDLDIDIRDDED